MAEKKLQTRESCLGVRIMTAVDKCAEQTCTVSILCLQLGVL